MTPPTIFADPVAGSPRQPSAVTTVLVADDDRGTRGLISATLMSAGYTPIEASDGTSALETFDLLAVRRRPPQLLVTDLTMPGLDGVRLIEQIRLAHGHVPVVVMTGLLTIPTLPLDVEILPKPFTPHDLLTAVQAALPGR